MAVLIFNIIFLAFVELSIFTNSLINYAYKGIVNGSIPSLPINLFLISTLHVYIQLGMMVFKQGLCVLCQIIILS